MPVPKWNVYGSLGPVTVSNTQNVCGVWNSAGCFTPNRAPATECKYRNAEVLFDVHQPTMVPHHCRNMNKISPGILVIFPSTEERTD